MEITSSQLKCINLIEENLDIKFLGETKKDATIFISMHLTESKRVQQRYPDIEADWEEVKNYF